MLDRWHFRKYSTRRKCKTRQSGPAEHNSHNALDQADDAFSLEQTGHVIIVTPLERYQDRNEYMNNESDNAEYIILHKGSEELELLD